MRRASVYYKKILAGYLVETEWGQFSFRYEESYFNDTLMPPISLTMPKTQQEYISKKLFPFFCNMISENVQLLNALATSNQSSGDSFSYLCLSANNDTIGAVTVKEI